MSERIIVSVSGGKDSTACYLFAKDRYGADGYEAVFADTGHEHPVTYNYLRNLPEMAGGPPITWVKADFTERLERKGREISGIPFLDMIVWKGRAPWAGAQFCTHELKLKPIKEWLDRTTAEDDREVLQIVGIRAGESARRAKMPEREFSDYYGCMVWRPLLHWEEEEVFALLERHGVPPNPLYAAGFSRVGCFPCIHARKADLARLPDWAWEKLADWEGRTGKTWFPANFLPNYPHKFTRIEDVRVWAKTSRGGKQLDMFAPEEADVGHCMATWGSCE